jgi:hypothetical protein
MINTSEIADCLISHLKTNWSLESLTLKINGEFLEPILTVLLQHQSLKSLNLVIWRSNLTETKELLFKFDKSRN